MLNGLMWTPKSRRKRSGYRHQAAAAVALNLLEASPKAWAAPSYGYKAEHRLRRRLRGSFLGSKFRSPFQYHLGNLSLLVAPKVTSRTLTLLPQLHITSCSPLVPLKQNFGYLHTSMTNTPIRAALRLFYLLLSTPTNAAVGPIKAARRWVVTPSGALSKAPFGSL